MAITGSLDRSRYRILFVDAFDSFSNNIVGLLEECCVDTTVDLVHIDDAGFKKHLESHVDEFDAIVVGPGPGHPSNPEDVGFIHQLWQLSEERMLPILGICLGFQSLCYASGAVVEKLARARHGIVNRVTHQDEDMFSGIGDLEATQYHSLRSNLGLAGDRVVSWTPSGRCPDLQPLAWDVDDEVNGPILMGVRHTTKPFWGVQFHPESICTSNAGKTLIQNWWALARGWSRRRRRDVVVPLQKKNAHNAAGQRSGTSSDTVGDVNSTTPEEHGHGPVAEYILSVTNGEVAFGQSTLHTLGQLQLPQVVEALGLGQDEVLILDSQGHPSGRYSIIGLVIPEKTTRVSYRVTDKTLHYGTGAAKKQSTQLKGIEDVWPALQDALDVFHPPTASAFEKSIPFWGGFIGYVSYEAGLESIDVASHPSCDESTHPDVHFAFIHRSIVIDHHASKLVVQSLLPRDEVWLATTNQIMDRLVSESRASEGTDGREAKRRKKSDAISTSAEDDSLLDYALAQARTTRPTELDYRDKVLRCQGLLASGDSYELCLTDETTIDIPEDIDEWALYKRLRRNNPAPHGAFLRLGDMTVIGSSPERFLRWTREGQCQFRPIKGTVKKGPSMTRELAHEILDSSKERAENLMIVDLIRHDLSGVIGADKTWVSKLMVVEEYETVYQLVSVIEGELPDKKAGLEVLKASLPPGSMTGAPKKRSCEILRDIEERPRGLYSGVLGYMDIGGAGDFSVVIRTAFKGSEPTKTGVSGSAEGRASAGTRTWRVGAGGAVTIQSTDEAEFHEMETKQSSVLASIFQQEQQKRH